MLLVLLPVSGLLAFTVFSAVTDWREARTLRDFRTATRVSFALTALTEALARERLAEVLVAAAPDRRGVTAERDAARRATDRALTAARDGAADGTGQPDVLGQLDAKGRQLFATRVEAGGGSFTATETEQTYASLTNDLLNTVHHLDSGRPSRASGRAADGYLAALEAIEAADRERADLAVLFATGPGNAAATTGDPWQALEAAQLDTFRQNVSGRLKVRLSGVLLQPAGRTVRATREALAAGDTAKLPSLERWLAASTGRLAALRAIADAAEDELATAADRDLRAVKDRGERELGLSVVVLLAVTVLALALRRSINRPLTEVSGGAKALADGDLSYDIRYTGRDEIGDVADTFRELHVTSERFAAEIRTMNTAIDDNRLGHRADVAAFGGTWAQLLLGMNSTMASFAAAHGRRHKAEQELESIFNLSLDLLCISGLDGYFKRVNPAFERTLGYPGSTLLSRPYLDFVHEEDRDRVRAILDRLATGAEVAEFENRYVRGDGTECWLQWSCHPVIEEGLIYAAARDVTESRRAAREQAALRSVATLVARGVPPHEVFTAVAHEVGLLLSTSSAAVLRYEADGAATVLGSALTAATEGQEAARAVAATGRAVRVGRSVGAPIVVDDRLWGAVVVSAPHAEPLPRGTESRLADFTELIATAIANADSRAQLAASRARGGRRRRVPAADRTRSARRRPAASRLAPAGPAHGRVHDGGPACRARRAAGAHRQGPGRRLRGPAADLPGHPSGDPLQGRPRPSPACPGQAFRRARRAGSGAAGGPPPGTDRGGRLLRDLRVPHQRRQARARDGGRGAGEGLRGRPGGRHRRRRGRGSRTGRRLRADRAHRPGRSDRRQTDRQKPAGQRDDADRTAARAAVRRGVNGGGPLRTDRLSSPDT